MSAGEAALPRGARMIFQSAQARTIERCEVTWEMLLLVTIQSAMQLVKLLVRLLVILRAPNEMQSSGIWVINEARSKDNRTVMTEMHKPLGEHTAERGVVKVHESNEGEDTDDRGLVYHLRKDVSPPAWCTMSIEPSSMRTTLFATSSMQAYWQDTLNSPEFEFLGLQAGTSLTRSHEHRRHAPSSSPLIKIIAFVS